MMTNEQFFDKIHEGRYHEELVFIRALQGSVRRHSGYFNVFSRMVEAEHHFCITLGFDEMKIQHILGELVPEGFGQCISHSFRHWISTSRTSI